MSAVEALRSAGGFRDSIDRETLIGLTLVAPAVLLIAGVLLFPFLGAVRLSFLNFETAEFVGLEHYRWLFGQENFLTILGHSVTWTVVNLLLQGVLGVGIALLLNRQFAGRNVVRTVMLIPFVIPTAVTAILWRWLFNGSWGPINVWLVDAGFLGEKVTPFTDPSLALGAVTLINVWRWTPLVALIVFAVLQTIPKEEYEAARIEGAGIVSEFYHVTYPHLRNALTVLGLIGFLIIFNIFDMIWLLTRGGPGTATTTMPVYIYVTAFKNYSIGRGNAISVVLLLILLVFVIVFFWKHDLLEDDIR